MKADPIVDKIGNMPNGKFKMLRRHVHKFERIADDTRGRRVCRQCKAMIH